VTGAAAPEPVRIGIDLGGTNLRLALVNFNGAILQRLRYPTRIEQGWEQLRGRLVTAVGQLMEDARAAGKIVTALGVGVPGLIGSDGVVHSSVNLPPLMGINVREALESAVGIPVAVANDANAIAWGELKFGAGRPFASFLMLTLGTGVGSGLVLERRLWCGRDGFAAEYGHTTVEPEGHPCGCGNRGCLEQYASATAIARTVRGALAAGRESALARLPEAELTTENVAAAARAGDGLALEVFERAGYYLAMASGSAVNLLNLEAIVLGGGVAASFALLERELRAGIGERAFSQMAEGVRIVAGELGDDAGLLGSAALAAEGFSSSVSKGGLHGNSQTDRHPDRRR
jgi:glucokinase